jgi:starch synthase
MSLPKPLRILFLCSEADPLVKVGGLGDVGGSLPHALRALTTYLSPHGSEQTVDIDIRLAIPFHGVINQQIYKPEQVASFSVNHKNGLLQATAYQVYIDRVPVYLIAGEPLKPDAPVYSSDWGYDAHKYVFFSLASLELARQIDFQPHVVHANDWHTSAAVYWLALHREEDPFYNQTRTLLSVHNLPFLGVDGSFPMESFYLPPAPEGILPEWARQLPLPLGLYSADWINTVSPTYGREILTPEFGAGLEGFLQTRSASISGILNGIDLVRWDPENDPYLIEPYSKDSLERRQVNKKALLREVGFLSDRGVVDQNLPLLAMITRMDYQKGIDLAIAALEQLARQKKYPWQALILGTGLPELEENVRELQDHFHDKIRAVLKFDAPLSHRIYAGADALLMPSRYEPCGLAQMIAMRYGCLPVARETGGLADTIYDVDKSPGGNGFLFQKASPEALMRTLQRVLKMYQNQPEWQGIQARGVCQDFSWKRSALEYLKLYELLISEDLKKIETVL